MSEMCEAYVVCEGYHDRAFWGGLLLRLGCSDPGATPGAPRRIVQDPWDDRVTGKGEHAFVSRNGGFIRIVPAGSKEKALRLARGRLKVRLLRPVALLAVSIDDDSDIGEAASSAATAPGLNVQAIAREFDPSPRLTPDGDAEIDAGQTRLSLVRWTAPDGPSTRLPGQQTLERLISAGISGAFPNRAAPVQQWLDTRPDKPAPCPKEHAWSCLAGWYADCGGYEAFMTRPWGDPAVAEQLLKRLKDTGVLRVAEMIANWS